MTQDIITLFKERILSLEASYEQKIAELSLLKELGDALKSANLSQWDELFSKQLDIIKRHTGIHSLSIMLLDEATQLLYVVGVSRMENPSRCPPASFKRSEGAAGKALSTSKTIYIPDVRKDPAFLDKGTNQEGSLACVPIISEGSPIGVLNFRDNISYSFGPNDLRFFELIADQLSITASLVRTYQDLIRLEKKRINLSRYFSRGLAEHLLADERMTRLGGEKKLVTTMFIDIANFTPIVETNPVEGVVGVLNSFFEAVVPIIFSHGGMLDKFLGDGIMAVFGIPDASDNDPVDAIQCAIEVQKTVYRMKNAFEEKWLFSIDVGIGIATGIAIAGNIGTGEQMNYTVIGEPVNLAERLESITSQGEIIVSGATADIALNQGIKDVGFESMGNISIKGISRNISPMKVIYMGEIQD